MKDKKDFEYTQDHYIEDYRRNKMLLGLNPNIYNFDKFDNGVRPVTNTLCECNRQYQNEDPIKGKTIDFYWFDEDNNFWFMGFTDGTFILRECTDKNFIYDSAHTHNPNMHWGYSYNVDADMCVIPRIISLYATNDYKPKITPIGKWLEEHTDIDVIGFYHHMVEQFTEQKKRTDEIEHERDLQEYNRLKEKLGIE